MIASLKIKETMFFPWGILVNVLIGAAIGIGVLVGLCCLIPCILGFTCGGVRGNSYASDWHSSIGDVESGSCFACKYFGESIHQIHYK